MVALETAAELWMSLTDSSQTQWLEYSGLAGEMLLDEVRSGGGGEGSAAGQSRAGVEG